MKLHTLREPPPSWLGEALERFEREFDYPLGEGRRFSISHGRDYLPFFAAMGDATVIVAEHDGEVLGTLVRVERWLQCHGIGTHAKAQRRRVHYLCDLKVSQRARCSGLLAHLMWETRRQVEQSGSHACYGIVMGGTGRRPTDYTGRCDIPAFQRLAEIVVLRITCVESNVVPLVNAEVPAFSSSSPACLLTGGNHALRSLMPPQHIGGTTWLEDTRRGKRLWTNDGTEMLSAHLSGLCFDQPSQGAAVIRAGLHAAHAAGMPAMFVAVPHSKAAPLLEALRDLQVLQAPATIYGHDLEPGGDWWVDTAEI